MRKTSAQPMRKLWATAVYNFTPKVAVFTKQPLYTFLAPVITRSIHKKVSYIISIKGTLSHTIHRAYKGNQKVNLSKYLLITSGELS